MKVKVEGSLTRKTNLSIHVKTETMHKARKVIATKKWRKYTADYLDQLLQYKIEIWILDLSYKVAYIFYNKQSVDKIVLFGGLVNISYFVRFAVWLQESVFLVYLALLWKQLAGEEPRIMGYEDIRKGKLMYRRRLEWYDACSHAES